MKEIWKDIVGYEGLYQVSSNGRVKSLSRMKKNAKGYYLSEEKILSQSKTYKGYFLVALSKDNIRKTFSVHRLVAVAFIPNPYGLEEINHKDENKANNFVDNLEWCDRKYNANYGTGIERCAAKKYKPVVMIDVTTGVELKTYKSAKDAMKETNINRKNIGMVCLGKRATAGGYIWKFK